MSLLSWPVDALAGLGRRGTSTLPLMAIIGIAVPVLGTLLKPFVALAVFLLLVLAFLRVDLAALRDHAKRPMVAVAIMIWTMLVQPACLCWGYHLVGVDVKSPDLMLALVLQAATSPMMSSPAIAAMLGLDAALVLLGMVVCTALVSFSAPLFVRLFVGEVMSISPLTLGLKLSAMLLGSALTALVIRRLAGQARIARYAEHFDGLSVILMFIFVAAVTGGVGAVLLSNPVLVLGLAALAFVLTLLLSGSTMIVFARRGRPQAAALGLMASQRNMGLMLGAAGAVLPDLVWLYLALAQLPIYTLPQLVKPVLRRYLRLDTREESHFAKN
jgi:predicted Na+-dependent transporter